MNSTTPIFFTALSLALASITTGCVRRELVGFDDHATKQLTAMRVKVDTFNVFWNTHEYVFYSCAEQGDKLVCKRLCGGSTDVECPTALEAGYGSHANIR
jgi:hypothetical protein